MPFSFRFPFLVVVSLFFVAAGSARNSSDFYKKPASSSSKKTSYSGKKSHSSNKEEEPKTSKEPKEPIAPAPKIISLSSVHHAPQAFGSAVLAAVGRDTPAAQIEGGSVQQLFGSHFLDSDQNFITTVQKFPLTPQRTLNEYRPEEAFAILLNDGTPFSWGELYPSSSITAPRLPAGRRVISMASSQFAFTALLDDGSLISWGKDQSSLTSVMQAPSVPSGTKVISIASTPTAFAALLDNGKILAWGNNLYGGLAPLLPEGKQAIALFSNGWAFAALLNDQTTVISWGHPSYGGAGLITGDQQIRAIVSTEKAFALLRGDHQVQVWGDARQGGVLSDLPEGTIDEIIPNEVAFTALFHDGTIFCWGDVSGGGKTPSVPPAVTSTSDSNVTVTQRTVASIVGNERAFAALLNDGSLITWGDQDWGGVAPSLADGKTFTSLIASQQGFSAFFDGGVLVWGQSMPAGKIVTLPQGKSISFLATTREAVAACFEDGSLQCWGVANCGGTTPYLFGKKVTALTSNAHAFTALLEDGTLQVWGEGVSSVLPSLPDGRMTLGVASPFLKPTLHLYDELSGIVVINNATTTQGQWQYAEAWSEEWKTIPNVESPVEAFALDATTRLRFLPASNFSGAAPQLIVKLLDAAVEVHDGEVLDVTASDPAAPYSTAEIPLTTTITKSFWESMIGAL
ncbi:MAG: hypothetical protein K2W97_06880 [Chthoniobacterales bacterium]|nr:hypothetical protein [Chthoniobacterales bacterium]